MPLGLSDLKYIRSKRREDVTLPTSLHDLTSSNEGTLTSDLEGNTVSSK